jgi:hypothetical protein
MAISVHQPVPCCHGRVLWVFLLEATGLIMPKFGALSGNLLRNMSPYLEGVHFSTNKSQEGYYLLGYNAVQSGESQPTFRRNI